MSEPLPDDRLDRIRFEPLDPPDPPRGMVAVHGAEDAPAVAGLLGFQDWPHLRYWADALHDATGGAYDEVGFAYDTDERWPEDEDFTGVRVFVPWDEAVVSRAAFERLMARFYAAIADAATRSGDPAVDEPWWPEITTAARALADRAGRDG